MGQKVLGLLCPSSGSGFGLHLIRCDQGRGLPPYQVASWSIEPFGHNTPTSQTDRQTGQDRQRSDSIGRIVLQTSPKIKKHELLVFLNYNVCRYIEWYALQWWSLETCVLSQECLEAWFFVSRSWLSLDTCLCCLDFVLRFHVSSCLTTVSWLRLCQAFCAETLAFLAESRPLGSFTGWLLRHTHCKTVILIVAVVLWLRQIIVSW